MVAQTLKQAGVRVVLDRVSAYVLLYKNYNRYARCFVQELKIVTPGMMVFTTKIKNNFGGERLYSSAR